MRTCHLGHSLSIVVSVLNLPELPSVPPVVQRRKYSQSMTTLTSVGEAHSGPRGAVRLAVIASTAISEWNYLRIVDSADSACYALAVKQMSKGDLNQTVSFRRRVRPNNNNPSEFAWAAAATERHRYEAIVFHDSSPFCDHRYSCGGMPNDSGMFQSATIHRRSFTVRAQHRCRDGNRCL